VAAATTGWQVRDRNGEGRCDTKWDADPDTYVLLIRFEPSARQSRVRDDEQRETGVPDKV
jgi:hypothetical protein